MEGVGISSTPVVDTQQAKRRMSIAAKNATHQHVNRRLDYLERRDKRIQEICKEWEEKLKSDPSTDAKPFVKSVNTIVFSGNKFKAKVQLISTVSKKTLQTYQKHLLTIYVLMFFTEKMRNIFCGPINSSFPLFISLVWRS